MLTLNLEALEQLLNDFSGELATLAFRELRHTHPYQELQKQLDVITQSSPLVLLLYEGEGQAVGHTLTQEDMQALQSYRETIQTRENIILERIFCYGFALGSNLPGTEGR